VGAAFLAYDVLYGPKARLQVSIRRVQLTIAKENQERLERSIRKSSALAGASEETVQRLREDLPALTDAVDEIGAGLRDWERHERRARSMAFVGLLLLMGGFACQAAGSFLLGRALH
jgi:uncharacterized protein YigA (DUF484 family)